MRNMSARIVHEPAPARPIFSTADFRLLRRAVLTQIAAEEDPLDRARYGNLYHRLGRVD